MRPQKSRMLEHIEQLARARDPRVKQVMAIVGAEYDVVLVARSDGVLAADVRPLVQLSVTVIVEEHGRREQGFSGGGGRHRPFVLQRGAPRPSMPTKQSTKRSPTSRRALHLPA